MLPLELKRHSRAPSKNFQLRLHRSRGKQGNQHGSPDHGGVKQSSPELQAFGTAASVPGKLERPREPTGFEGVISGESQARGREVKEEQHK